MIELKIQEYCNDCPYFNAVTEAQNIYVDTVKTTLGTEVVCEYADICRRLETILTKKEDS